MQTVIQQLNELADFLSVGQISKKYFGKTPSWLYHKLKGDIINGKPAQFTPAPVFRKAAPKSRFGWVDDVV